MYICEFIPTTLPSRLNKGPPEFPGLIATSVWINGVIITELNPEGLAAQQGIRKGDIITYLLNEKIRNTRDLSSAIEKAKENSDVVMIGIVREGVQTFRSLKLTK